MPFEAEACPDGQRGRQTDVPGRVELFWQSRIERVGRASAMHLHSYRDEDRSRHLDLIGGPGHPWSIDLVAAIASVLLLVGFGCALVAVWVH